MALNKNKLKELFQSGKKPSGDDFANLIDSFLHVTSEILTASRSTANEDEAEKGVVTDKYMTPYLVLKAIESLTTLETLPGLSNEVQAKIDTAINGLVAGAPSALNTLNELAIALNDDTAFNSLRGLINQKEPIINKNSGFNLNKSDAFNVNDANLLSTSKATHDLYDLINTSAGIGQIGKNLSTNFLQGTVRFCKIRHNFGGLIFHPVVRIYPNQQHIDYSDVRVTFAHIGTPAGRFDVRIQRASTHRDYPETRFDFVIFTSKGVAKSDSCYEDSSYIFASSKAVSDLKKNLDEKIDGKAASGHVHNDLQEKIDGKAASGHVHNDLQEKIDGKAASNHMHNDLQEKIDGKAASNHVHNDLQEKIDGKAASGHTHPLRVLKVGEAIVRTNAGQISYSRITHNNRNMNYVVCVTPHGDNGGSFKVYVANKTANTFDVRSDSDISYNIHVFYIMVSTA